MIYDITCTSCHTLWQLSYFLSFPYCPWRVSRHLQVRDHLMKLCVWEILVAIHEIVISWIMTNFLILLNSEKPQFNTVKRTCYETVFVLNRLIFSIILRELGPNPVPRERKRAQVDPATQPSGGCTPLNQCFCSSLQHCTHLPRVKGSVFEPI